MKVFGGEWGHWVRDWNWISSVFKLPTNPLKFLYLPRLECNLAFEIASFLLEIAHRKLSNQSRKFNVRTTRFSKGLTDSAHLWLGGVQLTL